MPRAEAQRVTHPASADEGSEDAAEPSLLLEQGKVADEEDLLAPQPGLRLVDRSLMPLYHIVLIPARVALYIVIHQDKRHEILHCRLRLKRGGYPSACSPRPQVKTGMSTFLLAFAAGESACHRWKKSC